jgi:hypothetical protein
MENEEAKMGSWLDEFLSSRETTCIPFLDTDRFEESFQSLCKLIGIDGEKNEPKEMSKSTNELLDKTKKSSQEVIAEKWDVDSTSAWLIEKKINTQIVEVMSGVDGFTLKQIYLIKTQTPEFFYQSLMRGSFYI